MNEEKKILPLEPVTEVAVYGYKFSTWADLRFLIAHMDTNYPGWDELVVAADFDERLDFDGYSAIHWP